MQIPIMVGNTNTDLKKAKDLAYNSIFNKYMKTSHRILCALAYAYIRGGEIIDFLFPAKVATRDDAGAVGATGAVANEEVVMETAELQEPIRDPDPEVVSLQLLVSGK